MRMWRQKFIRLPALCIAVVSFGSYAVAMTGHCTMEDMKIGRVAIFDAITSTGALRYHKKNWKPTPRVDSAKGARDWP